MNPTSFAQLAQWCDGEMLGNIPPQSTTAICIDSRRVAPGDFFVALRGENFNAHTFLSEVAARGACGALVSDQADAPEHFALIKVPDTLAALQQIAREYRKSLALKCVAITGSSGKTSTKDLLASVLEEQFRVVKTQGNLNNHIGLPLTILRADSSHEVAVLEIGMNHPGEIRPLAEIAAPDVAIITNTGAAHLEFMGSREAIANEKAALAESVAASGHVVLNANDDFSDRISRHTRASVVFAGVDRGDVWASDLQQNALGSRFVLHAGAEVCTAEIAIPGRHMVNNAVLAVASAHVLGMPLDQCATGLAKANLTSGRLEQKMIRGVQILDDTYNANPESMIAALRTLAEMNVAGRRIAVLGKMAELGEKSEACHREVGEASAKLPLDFLIVVGPEAESIAETARRKGAPQIFKVATNDEASALLQGLVRRDDTVLVKGSRSARMEQIIAAFATGSSSPTQEMESAAA
jgi:UDP-N-acetylmuramoyl-tripeptide--D-alanyl-D-alanine ligase